MSEQITRRQAVQGAGVVAVGAVAGFVVARNSSAARRKRSTTAANAYGTNPKPTGGTVLAPLAEVPAGGGKVLRGAAIVITRGPDDTVHAFSAVCPHQGCLVDSVANGRITCPCHGSRFDATTGAVVAGPAPSGLPPIAVSIVDGSVVRS